MDEVDLPPLEFAQLLVAQAAIQIHDEGGVHVFAPQLRSFREHARLLVGGVCASGRRREGEFHRLFSAQFRADQISRSEERRIGKEGRYPWAPCPSTTNTG